VPFASHAVLAPRCAAVVCQGGHGTLLRALMHGTPVLCIPGGRDQFDNTQRVVQRDAGLRLWSRASARSIGRAVSALLGDDRWRHGALALGAGIRADCDHGSTAADALESFSAPGCVSAPEQIEWRPRTDEVKDDHAAHAHGIDRPGAPVPPVAPD
jgi:UDP:flavonoid glycosyltransferase YjiC (YdhE family)